MSKGLEALAELYSYIKPSFDYQTAKAVEDYKIIEKELKALEIIKNKQVQVAILSLSNSCVGYNMTRGLLGEYLTEEEYELLKEVLL